MPLASPCKYISLQVSNLHLPRILCLHGGGVNASIFKVQTRVLVFRLSKYFRFIFVEAPFISDPDPAIVPIYGDQGPFRRWMRWLPHHPELDIATMTSETRRVLVSAMDQDDDDAGGFGPWVGLLGFSQGAKVAASVLYTQQLLRDKLGEHEAAAWLTSTADPDAQPSRTFQFAVVMAGRAPLVTLDPRLAPPFGVVDMSHSSPEFVGAPEGLPREGPHLLHARTIHVHGMQDPALRLHRLMYDRYCAPGTATLVEWEGGHRLPFKTEDVEPVTSEIIDLARELGIIKDDDDE
ncbi:citrinin biosynthesis oxidoreductase CtnB [Sodiomyces alkalinus F11]|uniref:Citrinin biosynthesis oxidoreductase CtnB n=1 Tax=Sodiomyces alkalinus (strain CBS 110278 / VKM F-3762 / F11) TaxID=1314773 RepID=A0A3N2PKP7_SODAK|nr:citrinin biosynthesis oxidoreductase CtnB [Sodiomyces alkalinus F11]ROT35102.1 citrinin biosynthesis oxidoreductase CtnB [Sodiomyces alkalinus F11]